MTNLPPVTVVADKSLRDQCITDMEVQLSGKSIRTAEIIKRNDGEEGPLFSFTHAIHEFVA